MNDQPSITSTGEFQTAKILDPIPSSAQSSNSAYKRQLNFNTLGLSSQTLEILKNVGSGPVPSTSQGINNIFDSL